MPTLPSPKYEKFAQARAKGMTADKAYVAAGYKRNDSNAARLNGNDRIKARIAELVAEAASTTIEALSFDAKDIFRRLERVIGRAEADGDHKTAVAGYALILECFGYKGSPTLTHEHVLGKRIDAEDIPGPKTIDDETPRNILAFGPAHRKMIEITGKKG